jgi:hypothetical protein
VKTNLEIETDEQYMSVFFEDDKFRAMHTYG